jgi:hypothetical protein
MMDVARVGPLYNNAMLIRDLIRNQDRTGVVLVTLAEEMPISETLESAAILKTKVGIKLCGVAVNAVPSRLFHSDGAATLWPQLLEEGKRTGGHVEAAVTGAERALRERERAEGHIRTLRRELGLPLIELPLLPRRDMDLDSLQAIAAALKDWHR